MRAFSCIAASLVVMGVTSSAAVGSTGKYENLLLQALMANAAGECPATLMREELKKSCDSQLPELQDKLAKLGDFKKISFQSTRAFDGGPAEVYTVSFVHGEWTWVLNTQSDGRMFWAFAPNPPVWDIASYSRK